MRFGGATLVFTRSNLSGQGGARHVQVTRSADGVHGWSRFEQLHFEGLAGVGRSETNIYFFTVRAVGGGALGGGGGGGGAVGEEVGGATLLLGTFPAVLGGVGGVYASVSRDGVRWSAPVRRLGPVMCMMVPRP